MAGARHPAAWGLSLFTKGVQPTLSSPDTHVILPPRPSEAEGGSWEMLFVPRGGWEMDVAGSSGICFLVAH